MRSLSMNKAEYEKKAQEYEQERALVAQDAWRLHYHIMPETGWLNDPNGLCQFHGVYHVYYQYSPFDVEGKVKLWGHVTSKDLLHWKQEEPVLFPDSRYDLRGVYSGSAWIHQDELYFYYTGNVKLMDQAYDYINEGREQNTILVTSADGYQMEEKMLVMSNEDYPSDMSCHVRDPKLYEHHNHTYMVLGARDRQSNGCVLVYETKDLKQFSYVTRLELPEFGYMWECPDVFDLQETTILIACPQGVQPEGLLYQNVYQCGYFILDGELDHQPSLGEFHMLDYGFDFYAPQSFMDEQGRRIMIGWMGLPDIPYTNPTAAKGWQHALTLPRVLTYHNGELYQTPVAELKQLRCEKIEASPMKLVDFKLTDRVYECQISIDVQGSFTLQLREATFLHYDHQSHLLTLSFGEDGSGRDQRSIELVELHNITIYSDTSSLELFINDGVRVMTTRVYETVSSTPLAFLDCKMSGNVVWYKLSGYTWES